MTEKYQRAVEIFEKIRDPYRFEIPYRSCFAKNSVLVDMLNEEEIPARLMIVSFNWTNLFKYMRTRGSSLDTHLDQLKAYLKEYQELDIGLHVYAQVNTGKKYFNVDSTWDKPLERVVPFCNWDGVSNGTLAVPPQGICYTSEESQIMLNNPKTLQAIQESLVTHAPFFSLLNETMQAARKL